MTLDSRLRPFRSWLRPPRLAGTLAAGTVWTLVVWGNRIGLITSAEAENPWAVARIAGSLGAAALLGWSAWHIHRSDELAASDRIILSGFFVWNLAVWVPSLVGVIGADHSIPFKAVHSVLAGGSIAFGAAAAAAAWSSGEQLISEHR